jgi:hypothetical protein
MAAPSIARVAGCSRNHVLHVVEWVAAELQAETQKLAGSPIRVAFEDDADVPDGPGVRLTDKTVELFQHGKRVAAHLRSHRPGRSTTLEEHRPKSHQRYLQ